MRQPIISLYAGDAAPDQADEPKEMTLVQLARRKQWAIIVCLGAQNETSKRQAHADAHAGDDEALNFLSLYGLKPQAQGHRVLATSKRPRRNRVNQPSGAKVKV